MPLVVYVTSDNTARFECPHCHKSKAMDVSRFLTDTRAARIKVKCPCGCDFPVILEKRRGYRKDANLAGTYIHYIDGREAGRGVMTVKDISAGGVKLRITSTKNFSVGDFLRVEFHLDDSHHSMIQKKVVVRNIGDTHLGCEFAPTEATDKALGFYLYF